MTASSYLPTQLEDKSLHNELIVQIHRCNGLEKLTTDQTLPDSYVAYQLFDLPVHMSKAVKLSSDPEFNDTRAWTLPVMSQALHEVLEFAFVPFGQESENTWNFSLVKLDCSISEASIDVSIHWKFSYVFETDDELQDELISKTKVREPTQSQNFPGKTKEVEFSIAEPLVPFPEQSQESENNALSSKPKESSENQLKPISASARLQEILRPQTPNEEEDSEKEDLEDQELERRLLHLPTPHSPVQKEEPERVLIPPKLCHAPAPSPPLPEATIAALHIDNGSVASSPASSSVASDATYTTSSTQQPVKPSKKDNPSTEKPKVEEQEIEETVEEPQNSDRQMEKMLELGEKVQLSPDRGLKSGGTEEKPLAAVRRSLLGDLPSLQPVAAKRATKAVEFTTPLHSSIPPSEASSVAESNSDLIDSSNESDHLSEEPAEGVRVRIRIGRLRILEGSFLLSHQYEGAKVFVEWNFLDFNRDVCETPGNFPLPRKATEVCNIDAERAYELNQRRLNLLSQWTTSNNRLSFTLVLDPGEDQTQDFDDLCVAELNLKEVFDTPNHFLTMRNVDNVPMAMLEVAINYSDKLMEYL
uniref:RPGRIP1 C-terminal domain-containing protein n=1 Tax=Ditylenchus dipsaci TaxID=166011 RepID=A0A915CS43_9BILA